MPQRACAGFTDSGDPFSASDLHAPDSCGWGAADSRDTVHVARWLWQVHVRRCPVSDGGWRVAGAQPYAFWFIFAQESRNATARLKTSASGVLSSQSAQKYPWRSNW